MEKKFISKENLENIISSLKLNLVSEIVDVLPTVNITKKIYLVLNIENSTDIENIYDAWLYINNNWIKLGNTNYKNIEEMNTDEVHDFIQSIISIL